MCGELSTTITTSSLATVYHASEQGQFQMTRTFSNSNSECPITSITLDEDSGLQGYSLQGEYLTSGQFTIFLSFEASTMMGIYPYTATAARGASR